MYEVPVKIYNISKKTKSVNIKHPHGLFKVDTDKKNKRTKIAPGLHLEIIVIFETDQDITEDQFDEIVITSDYNFRLVLPLKAYLPQPLVQFEPLVNLGFVPVGTKKIDTIQFLNDGTQEAQIELKLPKRDDLYLDIDTIILPPSNPKFPEEKRKKSINIYFEPRTTQNLHEQIEVKQLEGEKILGYIEIIATSVVQQMSVVFEEGGGPQTDINFGLLYQGQKKECSAFLVNNGPKEMLYKFIFHPNKNRTDFNDNYGDDDDFASTPEEAGLEMTQRILSASPIMGSIKAYSQIPITFLCNTKMVKQEKGWNVTLCPEYDINNKGKPKNLRERLNITQHFESLAAIKFEEASETKLLENQNNDEFCKTISVYMEVKTIYPDITLDKTSLNFWECNLKEKKLITITITNKNNELPIDFSFSKIPHFTVEPNKGVIKPSSFNTLSSFIVNVYFHPENIGNFSDVLFMRYVNDMYEIPIQIYAICKGMKRNGYSLPSIDKINKHKKLIESIETSTNYPLTKGLVQKVPDELALDFTKKPFKRIDPRLRMKKFHNYMFNEIVLKVQKNDDLKGLTGKGFNPSNEVIKKFEENFQIYKNIYNNKSQANQELVKMRKNRLFHKQLSQIQLSSKNNLLRTTNSNIQNDNQSEKQVNTIKEISNLRGNRLISPKLKLPEPKDSLWVLKPVGKYEPIFMEDNNKKTLNKSPDDLPETFEIKNKMETGEIPRTHQEIRECNLQLSGEDLQKIQVGCKEMKMGQIFKNSERAQTFWVKNNYRNFIFVKLEIDNNLMDLQKSYPKSHVIAPGEMQGFRIVVYSSIVKKCTYPLKYTINYKHSFKLKIEAEIILVKLDIQNNFSKFMFKNEKLDKDKVEMSISQKLRLYNGGNAPAEIFWEQNKEKVFTISPMKDIVPPNTEKEVTVTFNPFNDTVQKERYPEEFKLNIINGEQLVFPVEGLLSKCNVVFPAESGDTVFFKNVHTKVPSTKTFHLKNETSRVISAYQIKNPYPEILEFKETKGYLTDKLKVISVTINYKEPNPEFSCEVPILIRGGKSLLLKIKAHIVQPEVIIKQDIFDFGGVSFNEQSIRLLTLYNKSKLPTDVIINLNDDIRLKDFKLILKEKEKEKGIIIKTLEKERKEEVIQEEEDAEEEDEKNEEEEISVKEKSKDIREFIVSIPSEQTANFDFIFCPNSFENDIFDFETNFKLVGANEEYKGLRRKILAKKIDSIITISEMVVKFPKTFIYKTTNNVQRKELKIGSMQQGKKLIWKFIIPEEVANEEVFDIQITSGEISPNQESFIDIPIDFCPKTEKEYKSQVTLRVEDEQGMTINKTIQLIGEGVFPRIYFDQRELILPIVPLGWESSIKFKIKNEGYENEEINGEFESYPQGNLPLKLIWSDNNHDIGLMKKEINCEIRFISQKPLSFTTKLIFFDREGQQFPIQVAGTTDNCIFTNYSFFQITDKNSYEFVMEKDNSINLKKLNYENGSNSKNDAKKVNGLEDDKKSENNSSSFVGSSANTNSNSLLGYRKINNSIIDLNCKMIKKYLKKVHLDDKYKQNNSFKVFPDDVIRDNGSVIYILIKNLIGKEPPGRIVNLEMDLNQRALQVRDQYCQLIRFLQECGACLNTVFPEYLLDLNLFKRYIALDKNREKILDPKWNKSKRLPLQWRYYHKQSWILLVYQILKIFYLSRVNIKSLALAVKHLPSQIQSKYLSAKVTQSNVYTSSELLLLRWVSACFESVNASYHHKEIKTFSNDFSDSSLLTSIILSYFPKEEKNIRKKQQVSELKILPYSVIINILKEYGIFTHIKKFNISPTNGPNAREVLLFLTMLFQNLQHFYPKDTIYFSCILGDTIIKSIALMNPTNKVLEYSIKYDANESFSFSDINEVKIEPSKEIEYQITFKSKFSKRVDGKLYFINKKQGWNSQAAPIVYNLVSNITGRKSLDYKIISTHLYSQFA